MIEKIRDTRGGGADLTIFPECALTGYCFNSIEEARPYAEPIPGPSVQRITEVCSELGGHVVYGLLEGLERGELQLPRLSASAIEHPIGLFVAEELLLGGIPG